MNLTKYFVSVFTVYWWQLTIVSGVCPIGKYGPNCDYDCNCAGSSCNEETGCNGNCAAGWLGTACQAQNVALNRPASHSPDTYSESDRSFSASLAVDGRRGHDFYITPCSQAGSTRTLNVKAQWNVRLGQSYDVYRFIIDTRLGCCKGRLNRFELYVGQISQPGYNYTKCYQDSTPGDDNSNGPGAVIHGHCNSPLNGDLIQIRQTNFYPLTLCEVMVYVCSTGWYGEECNKECTSTTHCKRCDSYQIRCQECVVGKWDEHCNSPCHCLYGASCAKDSGRCPNDQCAAGYKGPTCATTCTSGKYGPNCLRDCGNCKDGYSCDIKTGNCPQRTPRCSAGYSGDRCEEECRGGLYGADCTQTCGQCSDGQTQCDRVTGNCPDSQGVQCQAGWSGSRCTTECPGGFYGADCTQPCGQCAGGQTQCDRVTGNCPDSQGARCQAGWSGLRCKTECEKGSYGPDCRETCGQCRSGSDKCDSRSGTCPQDQQARCTDGYEGDFCKTKCAAGNYGTNCRESCGNCSGGVLTCRHTDGHCESCAAGWQGIICKQACSAGSWGENCKFNCSAFCVDVMMCDIFNGTCVGGCKSGYRGERCEPEAQTAPPPAPVGRIVGVIVAVVVVVVIASVIVGMILLRRKKRNANASYERKDFSATSTTTLEANSLDNLHHTPETAKNSCVPVSDKTPVNGSEYYNVVDFNKGVSGVAVDDLWEYVSKKRADGGFKAEYDKLPRGLKANHEVSKIPENKDKSRFMNIVAYDHSRVVLKVLDNDPNSTYINACYIHGYKQEHRYIASQGPTLINLNDFIRMIWEEDCGKIVMLTNLMEDLRKKCDQYWPSSGSQQFGLIQMTLLDEEMYADFVVRVLQFTHAHEKEKTKIVKQYHFTSWPDHGVPHFATALLNFREKIMSAQTPLTGPIVVHCSAGIGRTGTFIALDYLIDQAKDCGYVDVPKCALLLRKQRVNMIQTQEQYEFLYEALVEALKLIDCTTIPSSEFQTTYNTWETKDPVTGKIPLNEHFKALKDMTVPLRKKDLVGALSPENKQKNRSNRILAAESCRPYLSTPVPGGTDYINAVFMQAYKTKKAFVITQMPLPNTVVDFWRLLYEQSIKTIVMLNVVPGSKVDKTVGIYWPDTVQEFGPFVLETLEVESGDICDVRTIQIYYKKDADRKYQIKQFQCKFWPDNRLSSTTSEGILNLLEQVEYWQQRTQNGPIAVHCMDGVTQCGVYCAATSVIERLKVDQEVNLLHTVKQMRINRPEIITDLEQFRFLHQLVLAYLDSFQTYSNFK